jgi:2,4-dienoyl-CoA reductase-like NADH-dependent reductase (Old Yellow Enzyme family)
MDASSPHAADPATERPALLAAQPLRLGAVTLRNRIVSAPMERNFATRDGLVTDQYVDYLAARAAAGVALVTTEATFVRADGKGRTHQLGAHDDACIPGLRRVADAVHAHGALVCAELNHGGRTAQPAVTGLPTVAPSPVPCEVAGGGMPRELTTPECHQLVLDYAAAARRCVAAGFDVLNLHGAHGYLIHQFLSPLYNLRTDEFAVPERFLELVVAAVRQAAPKVALGLRISVLEGPPEGLDPDGTLAILRRARIDGVDFLDLSAGSYEAGEWIIQSGEWARGFLAEYTAPFRELGLPLGLAGRLKTPESIEAVLDAGDADFVSLARGLHADPALATACLDGRTNYRPCIACNACVDNHRFGQSFCTVNPDVGRDRLPLPLPPLPARWRVTVVGGGPAGITAAREFALAGATVSLLERHTELGGQMRHAARMRSTPEFGDYLAWAHRELPALGVILRTGIGVDAAVVAATRPDLVVVATGGIPTPNPGVPIGQFLDDCLVDSPPPRACTIVGNTVAAMTLADSLSSAGTDVVLVAESSELAPEVGRRAKILALPRLRQSPHVQIRLGEPLPARFDHPGPVIAASRPDRDPAPAALVPAGARWVVVGEAAGHGRVVGDAVRHASDIVRSLMGTLADNDSPDRRS